MINLNIQIRLLILSLLENGNKAEGTVLASRLKDNIKLWNKIGDKNSSKDEYAFVEGTLSKLKSEGFVISEGHEWSITKDGIEKFGELAIEAGRKLGLIINEENHEEFQINDSKKDFQDYDILTTDDCTRIVQFLEKRDLIEEFLVSLDSFNSL